uniref:Proteasome activator complex subunit 4 C-terminal domain-containing protein n=1 Tax=Heliothis virescens TaxID=7102 RepID=A0A2A4JML8_HELVI
MIQDDEFEFLVTTPERIEALGFKPQKEILTNHILPYAAELDEESILFLEQVKINLAKAVMLREMKPGCGVWSSRLMKYIRIHGLKFSKEDHLKLIRLAYELVLIPDLEPGKVHKFATMFLMLTKKRQLITPEELTLPWRPLYDMGKKIFDKSSTHIGMYHYLTSLEGSYISMVKCARPYFPISATKEILAELLPQINPWSTDTHVVCQLAVFLPVAMPPRHAAHGHLLWFDEIMTLWDTCYNSQCGISDLMMLFAGLAKRNPGAIDWTPHVPKMFTRFLHALNLPVSYKDMQITRCHSLDMKHVASWIVWSISPNGVVLKHLRSFLAGVESYLHSANAGRWSYKLRDLLRKLAREFLNRVRREREKRFYEGWENQTPEPYQLRDEDITEFVNIVLEPTLQAVYSRSGSLDISIALQNLATLRPAIVVPPLLERLKTSLTSLTEPHRVTAAMSAVAAVARPMLRGADADYPEGPTHVVPFLLAVLPGLDPNDIKKTLVTLHFILIFTWMVPFIDCSSAHEHYDDLTEEELLTCESTAQFEDFVLVFLDRLFVIIESSVLEHVRLDTKESDCVRSKTDAVMETAISSAATAVLMQCSPKIFKEALRKFKAFATESTFETNVSGSMVGVMLRVFARIDSEATLAAFMPKLCEELTELLSTDEALHEENPPRDLMYRLVLFMHVVECDGMVLLKYIPDILPILDRALKLHANYALSRACEVLSHMLMSLCYIDLKEWKSSPKDYGKAPEEWLPIREWGYGCMLKDANLKWHVPTAAEAECAQMLLDRYLKAEVGRLRQWLNGERPMCRERRLRSFYIINAVLACSTFLPPPDEEPVALMESQVPATSIPFTCGVRYQVKLDGENVRVALTRLLLDVQAKLLDEKTDDTRGLEMLIQVWERVVVMKGLRGGPGLEARLRSYGALERALDGRGGPPDRRGGTRGWGAARLRMLAADAARLHDDARYDLVCEAGITPSALKALHALADLSVNTYSSVRILAQIRLYWMLSHYPYSYRALVPKLAAILAEGGEGDEWHARHKGVLFMMLGPRTGPLVAKQDWDVVRTLWPAILNAPLSEKPSMVRLEQAFSDSLHRHFPTVNTRLTMSIESVIAAAVLLTEEQRTEPHFKELLNASLAKEQETSDKCEKQYNELIMELIKVVETPNIQWRRLELAIQMLTFCPSLQTPYPGAAVRGMVRALLHDDIAVRRTAQRLVNYVIKQRKHKIVKVEIDPYEIAGVPRPEKRVPGYRKDLEWAIWSQDRKHETDAAWETPWLRNPTYGFYCWPEKLEVAAPSSEQVFSSDLSPEDMEEGERHLFEFFTDESNVDRLVAFLTVEEKKGKDKFNGVRFSLFRTLFAQFGSGVARKFLRHAERCACDSQEAAQRFAAEVAAAALRAPRYWPRARAQQMYAAALNILEAGLTSVTPETLEDWGTCVATGVEKLDPTRGHQVLTMLLDLCAPQSRGSDSDTDSDTSFSVCARLYALQPDLLGGFEDDPMDSDEDESAPRRFNEPGADTLFRVCARLLAMQGALGSLRWRAAPLAAQLLKRLEDANFIQHPYQNVRETVGSLLMTIFDTELVFPGGSSGPAPRLADFLASVQPRLAALYDENGDIVIKTAASAAAAMQCSPREEAAECGAESRALRSLAAVGNVGEVAMVDVARLSPDHQRHTPTNDDAPQAAEGGEAVEAEGGARGSRVDKQLVARLESALRLAGDAAAPAPHEGHWSSAGQLNLLTTVLRGCMGVIVRGVNGNTETHYTLVATACALAARGPPQPHDELPRAAAGLLASLALAHHDTRAFDVALQHLSAGAEGRSWWARLACIDFAQPLLFYGLPMLCDRVDRAVATEQFALKLMRDPRLEVRQSAAKLLTGLMHCRALPDEERTLAALTRSCRSAQLVERHCGVLGLCGYLASRPYSLGSRLGAVLAELARHTSAPDPVPAAIRAALADFRRTHQDDWPRHRDQLTEEELDLLADLTSPPSYCA